MGAELGVPDTRAQDLARREALMRQVIEKRCERLFGCYPVDSQRVYGGDMETCVEMEGPHFFALASEIAHVEVEEGQVQECLASLEQWACHYFIEGNRYPLAKGCDFRGDKAIGEPCRHPWACETGLCSASYNDVLDGKCEGSCQERIELGEPCDTLEAVNETSACADDSLCDPIAKRCVYSLDEGEELDRNGQYYRFCGYPMTSANGETCAFGRLEGETCGRRDRCFIQENIVCNFDREKGPIEVCVEGEFVPLGGECKPLDICEPGLRCSRFERCVVPAAEGESCERDACEWGLTCLDDVCRRPSLALCEEQAALRAQAGGE